jgi:hypothetical protein
MSADFTPAAGRRTYVATPVTRDADHATVGGWRHECGSDLVTGDAATYRLLASDAFVASAYCVRCGAACGELRAIPVMRRGRATYGDVGFLRGLRRKAEVVNG